MEYDFFDACNEAGKPQEMAERFRAVKQSGKFVHFANRPSGRFFGRFHPSRPVTAWIEWGKILKIDRKAGKCICGHNRQRQQAMMLAAVAIMREKFNYWKQRDYACALCERSGHLDSW